jgi:hypothetical protein
LISLFIIFFVAAVVFAGEAPYNPNAANEPRYIFCRLHDVPNRSMYYSSIFMMKPKDIYQSQDAFLHFVANKYSYKIVPGVDQYHMPVDCKGNVRLNETKSLRDGEMQEDARVAVKAVETGWTFGSQKAVEETPAPSTSSASNGSAAQDDKVDAFTMATLQQDPRGLNLSPLDRQFVLSEVPKAKSYCAKDSELSQNLDCTCFVRTVFNYRIAHASGPIQQTNFPPLNTLLTKSDFSCSECVKGTNHNAVACDRGKNPH